MVCNYEVFDAVIEVIGDDAHFHQVTFDAVGSEADDAFGPTPCHARNLQQLIFRGMVDVDPRFGGRRIFGSLWCAGGVPVLTLRRAGQANASNRNRTNRESRSCPHRSIVYLAVQGLQAGCFFDL